MCQGPASQDVAEHYLLIGSKDQLFSPFASMWPLLFFYFYFFFPLLKLLLILSHELLFILFFPLFF